MEPVVVVSVLAAGLYLRGWITLSRRMPERFGAGRLGSEAAGRPRAGEPGGERRRVLRGLLDVARSRALRSGAALRLLAPRRARVLLRDRHALLAAGDPAVAEPLALATLDDDPVSRARRRPEQRAGRYPHLLRPRDLFRL